MKIDLDELARRASELNAVNTMGEHDPEVMMALVASIRQLYDAAYSALSLLPTSESARDAHWHAEQYRIRDIIHSVVSQFGDSVVEKDAGLS